MDKLTFEWRAVGSCKAQLKQLVCNRLIAFSHTSHTVFSSQTAYFTQQSADFLSFRLIGKR